jgi:hypothetical protein
MVMATKQKYFLAFFAILFSFGIFAQGDVTIIIKGNREVERASRIAEAPAIIDTVLPTPVIDYPRLSLMQPTSIELEKIDPASVKIIDKLPQLYRTYVKIGVGTEFIPLGEIYFNNTRSRRFHYGVNVKHLSSFGNIKAYAPAQFDRTKGEIFGSILDNDYTLNGSFHLGSQGLHYYGFKNDTIAKDSIRQRYGDIGFSLQGSSHKRDSANVNFKGGITYNNYNSRKSEIDTLESWRAKENYFGIDGGAWYKQGKEVFAADVSLHYNGYKYGEVGKYITPADSGLFRNNTVFSLRPHVTTFADHNRLKATVGLDFTVDGAQQKTKAYIYPIADVKYSLFNDIFIPYVGIKGGLTQNTFKRLTSQNEFILPNVELRNEHKAIDFYGGIKGTISRRIGFNIGASFMHIKNKALFVTDTLHARQNQFNVIYDTLNQATIEGCLYFQLKEKIKIDVIGKYNSYTLLNNSYAWNLPTLEFTIRGKYNLYEKLVAQVDLTLLGGRRALVSGPGPDVLEENNQYFVNLGFVGDANLSLEYLYNKRISVFFQMNNFAAQRYLRWSNYPVQAFQVMGGFTFKF